ncbi:XTP/dITP diphosphatase [Fervidibacillus halotolerans]|uniref:dITP/XTP pyrophosphatase n=1 Tax=Fervidibacillus halotolerans TaxID=2980027 RepID=A0A9E8RXV9_9BACI|nr:XTP/dITP diphosphatase [Fervidibacillus halotolerans]WAA11609.1 XTP/dITP diphosphatase [Fervidibacillus halotolerans]
MKEIIIATKNPGKAKEFKKIFDPYGIQVKTLLDFPNAPDIEETGKTFRENAILKAEGIAKLLQRPVIADDSGLTIDALDGRPGVYSARYAGENKNDNDNIEKVLHEMKDVPFEDRTAQFRCTIAVTIPEEQTFTVEGVCNGIILTAKRGTNGFGYDPIFYYPDKGKTFAELDPEEKNTISHRGRAIQKLKRWFTEELVRDGGNG